MDSCNIRIPPALPRTNIITNYFHLYLFQLIQAFYFFKKLGGGWIVALNIQTLGWMWIKQTTSVLRFLTWDRGTLNQAPFTSASNFCKCFSIELSIKWSVFSLWMGQIMWSYISWNTGTFFFSSVCAKFMPSSHVKTMDSPPPLFKKNWRYFVKDRT